MSDAITPSAFDASEGVADWRVLFGGATANFETGSFTTGVALVARIGDLADAANHHPDVDLRYGSVTVRLISHDVGTISRRDADLARRISLAASELGVVARPDAVQTVQFAIDAHVHADVMPFWRAVLGYEARGEEDLDDPHGRGPSVWFQQMDPPRTGRNRIHVDVCVPPDQGEARVAAALAAGGRLVSSHAPTWWTLADAEGNEVDVATMAGRE
ncbi:VOC family protein [Occultella aeris]|uniref:Putative pterin-4-alpha-carbinolamine dehydratase n=1 Tax=Occultella aeris TaxID=2761496 RepID=A0A7M4DIM6_9MICO|nr:VOC family protein [Occultella aeris]VZO36836.1 Putative pterin-4-alpha-carbinolamine dehydratase [Occultella aeris]